MSLQPGTRLGNYEVLCELGSGGMGEVYKARDLKLGREVAIKVLPQEMASDSQRLRRFEQEARAASALNHPNIVTIYEIGEHEGTPFIAMEYVDGVTLREILSGGPLPNDKLIRYATQMAEGLAKAHQAGIVHRDLKPENMMVTDDGLVKILDFGLAKLMPHPTDADSETDTMTKATQHGVILGTLQYMSPEQAASRPVDYRSDQFSFGSILYEMATGELAFKKDTMPQTLAAIIETEPEPIAKLNDEIPDQLLAIVERCLKKGPEKRYDATLDLAAELESVPDTMALSRRTRRRVLWTAAAILSAFLVSALGLNVFGLRDWMSSNSTPAPIDSIAVLPLRNLSGDPEQEYFVDGMTEALMTDLAKIGALKVISRSSIMRYKGTDKPLGEIAEELGVDAIVEGSALRVGNRVRITAQLIDPETDQALWAESYERDLQDVLLLQSEVARAIAAEIRVALTPEETTLLASARPVNPEAYQAYLKGRFYFWHEVSPQGLETALEYFQLALEKDPNYALAYAGVADVWGARGAYGFLPPREVHAKVRAAAMTAVQLDETLAEGHDILARVLTYYDWNWSAAEREYKRAIELNPNYADVRLMYSRFLVVMGRAKEARAEIERGLELDPHNPSFHYYFGGHLYRLRRYDEAIAQFGNVLRMKPNFRPAHQGLWTTLYHKRMYEEALGEAKKFFAAVGDTEIVELLERGYAEAGYPGAMFRAAEKLEARSKLAYVKPLHIALVYAHAGEKDRALEWLEKAYQAREPGFVFVRVDPDFDPLRDDPRFQDLLRRMNFPE